MPTPDEVSEAVVVWTGFDDDAVKWPSRDEARLVRRYGRKAARELLPEVKRWESDFYASDAAITARDLIEMDDLASARFKALHPDASESATEALAWCYTFDYK